VKNITLQMVSQRKEERESIHIFISSIFSQVYGHIRGIKCELPPVCAFTFKLFMYALIKKWKIFPVFLKFKRKLCLLEKSLILKVFLRSRLRLKFSLLCIIMFTLAAGKAFTTLL